MLLLEYAPYGDLLGYLRKSRGLEDKYYKSPESCQQEVSSYDLLSFAQQISAGMSFLASKKVRDSSLFSFLIPCQVGLKRSIKTENKKQSWRLSIFFFLEILSITAAIATASTIHYNLKNHRQPWIQLLTCTDSHYHHRNDNNSSSLQIWRFFSVVSTWKPFRTTYFWPFIVSK